MQNEVETREARDTRLKARVAEKLARQAQHKLVTDVYRNGVLTGRMVRIKIASLPSTGAGGVEPPGSA